MVKKINHIGIAVRDLDRAIKFFANIFGAELLWRKTFNDQKMESAMMSVGEAQFELVCTLRPNGVIGKFVENRGEGIHHVSLEVGDIKKALKGFEKEGLTVVEKGALGGIKFAFLHPKETFGTLFEIVEVQSQGG
jgi:methylmalonyl-CoA epimerase